MKFDIYDVFLLLVITVYCYWPSIFGTFTFDDKKAVLLNEDVGNFNKSLITVFQNDFWGQLISNQFSHKSYRPLTTLTFRYNQKCQKKFTKLLLECSQRFYVRKILVNFLKLIDVIKTISFRLNYYFGKFNAVHFHLTNVLLYVVTIIVLYYTIRAIFEFDNISKTFYFQIILLFIVHPVHVENVSSLVGRADLLSCICYLLSLLFYIKNSLISHLITLIFSVFFKETGISILGVCFAYDFFTNNIHKNYLKKIYSVSVLMMICWLRLWIMDFSLPVFQEGDNPVAFHPIFWIRMINYLYIYMLNIVILLWPQWLCFDWSMGCIPLITDVQDRRLISLLIFIIFILITIWKLIQNQRNIITAMGFTFLTIPFIMSMNIFFTVGFVIAERVLLLPSIGFCILITYGFQLLNINKWLKSSIWMIFCTIMLLRTRQRINDWSTEENLFKSGLQVCPLNAKIHYNFGKVLHDLKNILLAEIHYRKALKLYPKYDRAMNNLANLLKNRNELIESEILLKSAIQLNMNFSTAWMNLGTVLKLKGEFFEAEHAYLVALRIRNGNYAACYYNLGNLYLTKPAYQKKALECWINATNLDPMNVVSWNNILTLLDRKGETDLAKEFAEKALKIIPESAQIHFHYANILGKLNQFELAEKHYLEALRINASNTLYQSNLGVLYHLWKKFHKAKYYYELALLKEPNSKSILKNYQKLMKNLN